MSKPSIDRKGERLAVIDIGTNSVLLSIVEVCSGGRLKSLKEKVTITRLGEGLSGSGKIDDIPFQRTVTVIRNYLRECSGYGIKNLLSIGTSVLRESSNYMEIIEKIKRETGLKVEIISGEDEAYLSFLAARREFPGIKGRFLVLDIGGGSTEFAFGAADFPAAVISLGIGSVKLTERFIKSDPPDSQEISDARRHIQRNLKLLPSFNGDFTLIGLAGTITTLAAMDLEMSSYDSERIHGYNLNLESVRTLLNRMLSRKLQDRKGMRGLDPARADVIICGALILIVVMEKYGVKTATVSDRGVRYGVLYKYLSI